MEKNKQEGTLLTPEELAEAREWLKAPACSDLRSDIKTAFLYIHRLLATVDALTKRAERAEADRDLAIAHDRQPYPTAWAYDQACAALEKHRQGEAEALALVETLRGALERVEREAVTGSCGCLICGNDGGHHKGCSVEPIFDLLRLTQPQALAQQREYVGALEAVAEVARDNPAWHSKEAATEIYGHFPIQEWEGVWKSALGIALAELDAAKGANNA